MNAQKYIVAAFLLRPFNVTGQPRIQHMNMLWEGYYHSTKLSGKWSLSGDAQIRTSQWTNKRSQFLFRYGPNYTFKNRVTLTVRFASKKEKHNTLW